MIRAEYRSGQLIATEPLPPCWSDGESLVVLSREEHRRLVSGEATKEDREDEIDRLGELMSDVSEACHFAGWLVDTEFAVPHLCQRAIHTSVPQRWGFGEVTVGQARKLVRLSDRLGHWVNRGDGDRRFVAFNPFPVPPDVTRRLDAEQEVERDD